MNDMSSVIIAKCDELTADDLLSGPRTITITDVDIKPGTERPVTMSFEGDDGRPFKPCKTVSRCFVSGWGPDAKKYIGRQVTLFRDDSVKWGGMAVGGIRISHMSHLERDMVIALTATKGKKVIATVKPLVAKPAAAPVDKRRASAEAMANWLIGEIGKTADAEALAEFRAQEADAMTKLDASFTDLYNLVLSACHRQLDGFREGRPDTDMGENHTDMITADLLDAAK